MGLEPAKLVAIAGHNWPLVVRSGPTRAKDSRETLVTFKATCWVLWNRSCFGGALIPAESIC